jgi:integrase
MFPTANGTPLDVRNFMRDCVRPVLKRIGVTAPVTFQVLRRSAATRNQQLGTMKDVQALLRHGSI